MNSKVVSDGKISVIWDQDMNVSEKRVFKKLIRVVPRKQPFVPVHTHREQERKAVYIFADACSNQPAEIPAG